VRDRQEIGANQISRVGDFSSLCFSQIFFLFPPFSKNNFDRRISCPAAAAQPRSASRARGPARAPARACCRHWAPASRAPRLRPHTMAARGAPGARESPGAFTHAPQTCRAAVSRRKGLGGQGVRALVKRLRMRPAGVVSKKDIGARTTCARSRAPSAGRGRGGAAARVASAARRTARTGSGRRAAQPACRGPSSEEGSLLGSYLYATRRPMSPCTGISPRICLAEAALLAVDHCGSRSLCWRLTSAGCGRHAAMLAPRRGTGHAPSAMRAGPPRAPRAASCCVS